MLLLEAWRKQCAHPRAESLAVEARGRLFVWCAAGNCCPGGGAAVKDGRFTRAAQPGIAVESSPNDGLRSPRPGFPAVQQEIPPAALNDRSPPATPPGQPQNGCSLTEGARSRVYGNPSCSRGAPQSSPPSLQLHCCATAWDDATDKEPVAHLHRQGSSSRMG